MVSIGERMGLVPPAQFEVKTLSLSSIKVTRTSTLSGARNTMTLFIPFSVFHKWYNGEGLIQDLMPGLTPAEREFLISGATQAEWDATFPPEEGDE